MNSLLPKAATSAALLSLSAAASVAGGIERSTQSVGILFEEGSYAEFSLATASPGVSGSLGGGVLLSGDMAPSYTTYSFGYKQDIGDNVSVALILDQPVGADVSYPLGTGYPFQGSTAKVRSKALTGLVRYRFPSNLSIYGGVRVQNVVGQVALTPANYVLSADGGTEVGYVAGIAYEKPEIALRVALTYNSAITHTFAATDSFLGFPNPASTFQTVIPKSVNLEFQSGIAANTLLFGSVRWVNWTAFDITPPNLGITLVSYLANYTTYSLGVGRKFNDNWSGAILASYEGPGNVVVGNLGPTDGQTSIGLGVTYTQGNIKVTGGLRYIWLGDATTTVGASFTDNTAIAAGVRVGVSF